MQDLYKEHKRDLNDEKAYYVLVLATWLRYKPSPKVCFEVNVIPVKYC